MNTEILRDHWDELSPQRRTAVLKYGSAAVIIMLIFGSYFLAGKDEQIVAVPSEVQQMSLGTGMLEDDIRSEVDSILEEQQQRNIDNDSRLEAIETLLSEIADSDDIPMTLEGIGGPLPSITDKQMKDGIQPVKEQEFPDYALETNVNNPRTLYPPSPDIPATSVIFPNPESISETAPIAVEFIGAVARSEGIPLNDSNGIDELKKNQQFLMPPGFMQAKLLTGVDATTSSQGKEDGEPLMFRVQAPAILPNDLKANLKGCFIIGNGYGSLAKERIDVRLVSLHCVSVDGAGVVDSQIKGWVTGKDGKKGIPAVVVTRAGALIARSFVAGAFEGIGSAVSLDTVTQSINPLGSTQIINAEDALQAGVGQGIKSGSEKIQELYLDWARQSGPVLETGAAADVTIVVQETVTLEIKDWRNSDENG